VLVITLEDRLPRDTAGQKTLRAAVARMLAQGGINRIDGEFFTVVREDYARNLGVAPRSSERDFYKACCDAYGKDCHVSGALTADGGCLVVMRSRREDDHSKPQVLVIKKAASQLSGTRPGFIAVQYADIEPVDLTLPHLRWRAGLLANGVFHGQKADHVAGVYFCAFAGLHVSDGIVSTPAFVCSNPRFMLSPDGLPFRTGVLSNSEFARVLGVNPAETEPDDHLYGLSI
jgi:hypothetical protein